MLPRRDGIGDYPTTRRSFLLSAGVAGSVSGWNQTRAYVADRSFENRANDGIPDRKKRSEAFNNRLESIFGPDQFDGLDVGRRDLLLDVRRIGPVRIFPSTKTRIVDLFRSNGIYAQWLDYPRHYPADAVAERYGTTVEDLLWGQGSFYREAVEPDLKNVALQLFVVPGVPARGNKGRIYSHWIHATGGGGGIGYINGFSVGNRAMVANRDDPEGEARLIFHELAHLVLCHDDDPKNRGVMGSNDRVDLLDHEWEQFRNGLSNVRDTTDYDIALRPCLWEETLTDVLD